MTAACSACSCILATADSRTAHDVLAALTMDDLDRALASGLLDCGGCTGCSDACNAQITAARDARLRTLAARERYRARSARLQQRAAGRAAQRATGFPSTPTADALPPAAAAALARALAKAAGRRPR